MTPALPPPSLGSGPGGFFQLLSTALIFLRHVKRGLGASLSIPASSSSGGGSSQESLDRKRRQTETPDMECDLRTEPEARHVASKSGLWPSSGEEKDPSQELRSTFPNSPLTFKSESKWF